MPIPACARASPSRLASWMIARRPGLCATCWAMRTRGVRVLVCQALGRLADPASLPALSASVHDPSAEVRAGVLFAMASLARPRRACRRAAPQHVHAHGGDGLRPPMTACAPTRPPRWARCTTSAPANRSPSWRAIAWPACGANACASLGLLDDETGLDILLERALDEGEDLLVRASALDGLARRAERGTLVIDMPQAARATELACSLAERLRGLAGDPDASDANDSVESANDADADLKRRWHWWGQRRDRDRPRVACGVGAGPAASRRGPPPCAGGPRGGPAVCGRLGRSVMRSRPSLASGMTRRARRSPCLADARGAGEASLMPEVSAVLDQALVMTKGEVGDGE